MIINFIDEAEVWYLGERGMVNADLLRAYFQWRMRNG